MILNIQDDILKLHSLGFLDKLLTDKTTGKRIMWATDAYFGLGSRYGRNEEITPELITGPNASVIKTRARKELEQQSSRTRQHGEVSTPLWVCRKMCGYADEMWNKKARWQRYVDRRVLEITCGEAPFLVSRYDVETGEAIPVPDRIGLLDRKLRVVNENTQTEEEWLKWAFRAFWATYGYEFQGDNLLIARVNLLMTFEEYLWERWRRKPTLSEYGKLITVITWNIWQMDGLKGCIPYGTPEETHQQFSLFAAGDQTGENKQPRCRIKNWLGDRSVEFHSLPIVGGNHAMKFDFVIGNPPYQEEQVSENADGSLKNYAPPIYDKFMDEAFKVSEKVELIHPARFLFNAGSTPKAWNEKMLNDEHFKVLYYEEDGHKVFPSLSTPLRGGVAITYRDDTKTFGAIVAFTKFPEVNDILHKVLYNGSFETLMDIVYSRTAYRLTEVMHTDHPEARYREDENGENIGLLSKGHDYDMSSNIMGLIPQIFHDEKPDDGRDYIRILGRVNNKRIYKFIRRDYVKDVDNLDWYKVYVAQANGSGEFGDTMSEPVVEGPGVGSTETFLSVGKFKTIKEARAVEKYIKTKFARTLLSVLKVTQNGNKPVWKMIPLQDFTQSSDIDWSKSIPEIDQQLYKKYGLDEKEIAFIETHVKEMT